MEKLPFVTKEKAEEIAAQFPTPFHLYDVRGIRENAAKLKEAFAWNKGYLQKGVQQLKSQLSSQTKPAPAPPAPPEAAKPAPAAK